MALTTGVLTSRAGDWSHPGVIAVLFAYTIVSDLLTFDVEGRSLLVSGSFPALVLAMSVLGPAPAMAIGLGSMVFDSLRRRPSKVACLNNLATFAAAPLVGGLLVREVSHHAALRSDGLAFLLLVFAAFYVANLVNFALVAGWEVSEDGISILRRLRSDYLPVLPSELAAALLTVGIVALYAHVGAAALTLAGLVLIVFQYLVREMLLSDERARELERRTTQLASLHVGVLTAMIQTLSLRDHSTARHSAAVARYARELAASVGCTEEEQDLVHTAGLLHDIGKFILPDSILLANRKLTEGDWELVKLHPAQGAEVVRRVESYGPVADIILAHHERVDGRGYPNGLQGEEIPLLAKMISIADTYDVMTARDSYRDPVSSGHAMEELQNCADRQFEGWLVEAFIRLLDERGVAFRHADDADFEAELNFERRIAAFAGPRRSRRASLGSRGDRRRARAAAHD